MIVRLNIALRNLILNSMFNGGLPAAIFDNGIADFRSGANPAAADDAATGIVITSVALPADAMQDASNGSILKNAASWQDLVADATGLVGWSRFRSVGNIYILDFDVTDNNGAGAIKLDSPNLVAGQQFFITAFSLTMPAST